MLLLMSEMQPKAEWRLRASESQERTFQRPACIGVNWRWLLVPVNET
jgi:hypothetical protein